MSVCATGVAQPAYLGVFMIVVGIIASKLHYSQLGRVADIRLDFVKRHRRSEIARIASGICHQMNRGEKIGLHRCLYCHRLG